MDIWIILEYTISVTVIGLLIWLVKRIFHDKLDARWHLKTRISRIRDFRRLPKGIGLVTLCITLMLAVSAVGSARETAGFEVPPMDTAKNLERALLYASATMRTRRRKRSGCSCGHMRRAMWHTGWL